MPCSSGPSYDDSDANKELKKLCGFCKELKLDATKTKKGSHIEQLTVKLCERLQIEDVTKYSLELQIWWRDHQKADKARVERELKEAKESKDRKAALGKLSNYEKKLLGLK